MKHILKNNEPNSLRQYRRDTPDATYSGIPKKDVQEFLLEEQGYICAYCMRRISTDYDTSIKKPKIEIEHFRSQHRYPKLTMDYKNMLGVCNGNAGKPRHQLICDKEKSKHDKVHDLFLDPLVEQREAQIKYTREGEIFSDVEDIEIDLNDILNLNEQNIKEDRASIFQRVKREIRDYKKSVRGNHAQVKSFLEKMKIKWETRIDNKFIPLCRVALYVIEKEQLKYP